MNRKLALIALIQKRRSQWLAVSVSKKMDDIGVCLFE